jgi:hypothetical protein
VSAKKLKNWAKGNCYALKVTVSKIFFLNGIAGNHYQNFTDAIRENDPGLLTSPIEEGFYSCALIHLANISYRLGRTINFDPDTQTIINDGEATKMLSREYRAPYIIPQQI